jgi:hypothetical protein
MGNMERGPVHRAGLTNTVGRQSDHATCDSNTAHTRPYLEAGATTFVTEIHPTAERGYDFTALADMIEWRDSQR